MYTMNITLCFGKYKGHTVEEIAEADPEYLIWLRDNVEVAKTLISQKLYEECQYDVEDREREVWGEWDPFPGQD
jgi:hypothetical protein